MTEFAPGYLIAFLLGVLGVTEFTSDTANTIFAATLIAAGLGMAISTFSQQRGSQSLKKSGDVVQIVAVAVACLVLFV